MGSAALAAAVPYPGKATKFSRRHNEVLKNIAFECAEFSKAASQWFKV